MEKIDWSKRWPHFAKEEVMSPDQIQLYNSKGVFTLSSHALDTLHEFREFIGKPLKINHEGLTRRGARSMKEVYDINEKTRGVERAWEYSFHLWCAFDISCDTLTSKELFELALTFGKWGGIGLYKTFVHVDNRCNLDGTITTWIV